MTPIKPMNANDSAALFFVDGAAAGPRLEVDEAGFTLTLLLTIVSILLAIGYFSAYGVNSVSLLTAAVLTGLAIPIIPVLSSRQPREVSAEFQGSTSA